MDYSKYKYDQEKKERRVKKNQHIVHLKQIRFKPHIDEHDYQVKLRQTIAFLNNRDKVKINMIFQGREMMFKNKGREILDRILQDVASYGVPEKSPEFEGRILSIVLSPRSEKTEPHQ